MLGKVLVFSVMGLSMLATACSDDVTRVADNRGALPPGWESDISGVWDFVGSVRDSGDSLSGTLTIDREVFILQFQEGRKVHYSASPSRALTVTLPIFETICTPDGCSSTASTDEDPYDLTRDSHGVSLGVIPSDVGGNWGLTARDGSVICGASLDPDSFAASCSYARGFGLLDGRVEALRTTVLPSVFGELGGGWELTVDGGRMGGCTATLSDNNFDASCAGTDTMLDSTLSFSLYENIGSGSSVDGLEISATRR